MPLNTIKRSCPRELVVHFLRTLERDCLGVCAMRWHICFFTKKNALRRLTNKPKSRRLTLCDMQPLPDHKLRALQAWGKKEEI